MAGAAPEKLNRKTWATLDKEDFEVTDEALRTGPSPDVLTQYVIGTDDYAHVAREGPDLARRSYLREIIDPLFTKLALRLEARGALRNRYVVVTGDHGHTEVLSDDTHALSNRRSRPARGGPSGWVSSATF